MVTVRFIPHSCNRFLYLFLCRRRRAERKLDQWRFVINDLQDNVANESSQSNWGIPEHGGKGHRKARRSLEQQHKQQQSKKKQNNREDEAEWQQRKLLGKKVQEIENHYWPTSVQDQMTGISRQTANKYCLSQSRDSQLGGGQGKGKKSGSGRDKYSTEPPQHIRRSKSGQWDTQGHSRPRIICPGSPPYGCLDIDAMQLRPLDKRYFTQSAPDLLDTCLCPDLVVPATLVDRVHHQALVSTLVPGSTTLGKVPPVPARTYRGGCTPSYQ